MNQRIRSYTKTQGLEHSTMVMLGHTPPRSSDDAYLYDTLKSSSGNKTSPNCFFLASPATDSSKIGKIEMPNVRPRRG